MIPPAMIKLIVRGSLTLPKQANDSDHPAVNHLMIIHGYLPVKNSPQEESRSAVIRFFNMPALLIENDSHSL